MKKHTLRLLGGRPEELRVPAEMLADAVAVLMEGARRATRFSVEGESTRSGPRPGWLDAAIKADITGLTAGSAQVAIESPTLAEAAPDRFGPDRQTTLFADPTQALDAEQTAIDCFGSALASAIQGDSEHLLADRALLDTCVRFTGIAHDGWDGIELAGLSKHDGPLRIGPTDQSRIERLRDETPAPNAVRLAGVLDTISATSTDVVLKLASGEAVRARLIEHDPEQLKALFNERVVVAGMARYRPSGKPLVIDVEHIAPAGVQDSLWESLPMPRLQRNVPVAISQPQDEQTGVSALFGTWPGEESDEELQSALEALG